MAFAFSLSTEIERAMISQRTKEALARKKSVGQKAVLVTASLSILAAAPKEEQNYSDAEIHVTREMADNLAKRAPEICGTTGKELAQESDKALAQIRRCLKAVDPSEEVRSRVQKITPEELTKFCDPKLVDRCL